MAVVNLTSPYDQDAAKIARAQKYAEMLQQQAMEPSQTFSYNGIQAPIAKTAGLAKILQGLTGVYMQNKADEDAKALGESTRGEAGDLIGRMVDPNLPAIAEQAGVTLAGRPDVDDMDFMRGKPGGPTAPLAMGAALPTPGGMGDAATPGSAGLPARAKTTAERYADIIGGKSNPLTSGFADLMLAQMMKTPESAFGKIDPSKYTQNSVQQFMATGGRDFSVLVPAREVKSLTTVDQSGATVNQFYDPYATAPGTQLAAPVTSTTQIYDPRSPTGTTNVPTAQSVNRPGAPGAGMEFVPGNAVPSGAPSAGGSLRPTSTRATENTLRDEFNNLTKDFRVVQDAHTKINSTADTGAGDMSLLYSYVKLLDPGSVVRESEFAAAAQSGSLGQRVQNAYERIATGQRLEPTLKKQFLDEADSLYKSQLNGANRLKAQYTDIAKRNNVNPQNVIVDYEAAAMDSRRPPTPKIDPAIAAELKRRGLTP